MLSANEAARELKNVTAKVLYIIPAALAVLTNLVITGEQQYSLLSRSFLVGRLDFVILPNSLSDTIMWNGKYYWPNPPFPAILITPFELVFSLFGYHFHQGFLHILILGGLTYLLWQIFKDMCKDKTDILYWITALLFGSSLIALVCVPWSWFTAHMVAIFLTFLAYHLYKRGAPLYVIGLIYGCIVLTRFTAGIGIVFYFLMVLFKENSFKRIIGSWVKLAVPFVLLFSVQILYNYARYGTWVEMGYLENNLVSVHKKAREFGVFSLNHLPGNLYYFLLSAPEPVHLEDTHMLKSPYIERDPWGMSIFVTSPYMVLLLFYSYRDKETLAMLITSILIATPIMLYFGIGWYAYGYKYAADFLPFLFLILVREYYRNRSMLSPKLTLLIIATVLFNVFLVNTF